MAVSVPHVFATTPATPAPPASQLDDNFNALIAAINAIVVPTASTPRAYLAGMTLSNDSGTPNSILDIAPGQATDSTNAFTINLPTTITKSTGALWLAGNGNGGMGNGLTIAATTWYHVFAIINGGLVDCYFDTSFTAANKPSNTTAFRRIGAILTDGSGNVEPFIQNGDEFVWKTPSVDQSGVFPGVTQSLYAIRVPVGIEVMASFRGTASNAANSSVSFYSPNQSTETIATQAPGSSLIVVVGLSGNAAAGQFRILTNLAAQIAAVASDGGLLISIMTDGWTDARGRDA